MSFLDFIGNIIDVAGSVGDALGTTGTAVLVGVAVAIFAVAVISIKEIRKKIRERHEANYNIIAGTIKEILRDGNYNTVKIGLLNSNHDEIETIEMQSERIDSNVRQGMIISAY